MQFSSGSAIVTLAVLVCVSLTRAPLNPKVPVSRSLSSQIAVPSPVARSLKAACADCHSYETVWPWYARVPVVSTFLTHDVDRARKDLNFSDWQSVREQGPEQLAATYAGICENLLSGAMPKHNYQWMHPEAKLSKDDVARVCAWTDKQQMRLLGQASAVLSVKP